MNSAARQMELMTAAEFSEFAQLPENRKKRFELVRGKVIQLEQSSAPFGLVSANISRLLAEYTVRRRQGCLTVIDKGMLLERDPDTVRQVAVAVFDGDQRTADLRKANDAVRPLLAVDVLTFADRAGHVIAKTTDYLRNGVGLLWQVSLEFQTVMVFTPDNGPRVFDEKQTLTGNDVLPGLKCKVADFFRLPGDKTQTARKRKT